MKLYLLMCFPFILFSFNLFVLIPLSLLAWFVFCLSFWWVVLLKCWGLFTCKSRKGIQHFNMSTGVCLLSCFVSFLRKKEGKKRKKEERRRRRKKRKEAVWTIILSLLWILLQVYLQEFYKYAMIFSQNWVEAFPFVDLQVFKIFSCFHLLCGYCFL